MSSKIKNTQKALPAVVFLLLVASCTSRHLPSVSDNLVLKSRQQKVAYTDLTQLLSSIPDVKVAGVRETAQITIRRNIRFNTKEPPVFIVDGLQLGTDYSYIYRQIRVQDIRHIDVLNDAEARSTYGFSGENGAIVIQTVFSKR